MQMTQSNQRYCKEKLIADRVFHWSLLLIEVMNSASACVSLSVDLPASSSTCGGHSEAFGHTFLAQHWVLGHQTVIQALRVRHVQNCQVELASKKKRESGTAILGDTY